MGLVRMNRRTTHRLGSALRLTENGPIGRQGAGPLTGYTPYPEQERPFELAATLEEGGSANAYLRRPQPDGSYVQRGSAKSDTEVTRVLGSVKSASWSALN